jgi:hypothetical protein
VLSGQALPKPNQSTKGEVIDPYVLLDMTGVPSDTKAEKTEVRGQQWSRYARVH